MWTLAEKEKKWTGTMSDLLDIVGPGTGIKAPKKLSDELRRLRPALQTAGSTSPFNSARRSTDRSRSSSRNDTSDAGCQRHEIGRTGGNFVNSRVCSLRHSCHPVSHLQAEPDSRPGQGSRSRRMPASERWPVERVALAPSKL